MFGPTAPLFENVGRFPAGGASPWIFMNMQHWEWMHIEGCQAELTARAPTTVDPLSFAFRS